VERRAVSIDDTRRGAAICTLDDGVPKRIRSGTVARETATIQVLHSIKTLAVEMSYAMIEGDWKHLGELLDRHWELNQVLDPHTTNAPINTFLDRARPYIYRAKLAERVGADFL
jgi:galactokinase/mevalonate kinase-like predicted kinase